MRMRRYPREIWIVRCGWVAGALVINAATHSVVLFIVWAILLLALEGRAVGYLSRRRGRGRG
jgi:hypothetical protein